MYLTRLRLVKLLGMSLMAAGLSLGLALRAAAQTPLQAQIQFLPTPPDQGAPNGRQRGGATRGDCMAYEDLTALVPQVNGVVWSQTVSEMPTFFFDIPTALTNGTPVEFVVQDGSDNYVFLKQFSVRMSPGILAIPMTDDQAGERTGVQTGAASGLSPGESYSWTFSVYCDVDRPSASVSVSGTVSRVDTPTAVLANEASADTLALAEQYASMGIWHESLEILLKLVQANPNNVRYQQGLSALLEQANLADVLFDEEEIEVTE